MKRSLILLFILTFLLGTAKAANVIITSFNSGELSPLLGARIDFDKYNSGLQTALNAIPLPQGGITRRPGTEYLGATYGSSKARLIPFIFSEDQAYILEFTDSLLRVWADGGLVQTVDANTELLLHFDDYDGSTDFTDSGTNTHTVTESGDAAMDTSQKKFGQASGYFDGTGDYLSVSDSDGVNDYWNIGASDYTIDFWVRTTATSGSESIFEQYDDADNFVRLYLNGADDITFEIRDTASTLFSSTTTGNYISDNAWYHVAIVRDGDDIGYAVNGTWVYNTTDTDMDWPDLAADLVIGSCTGLSAYSGWLEEFRVSKAARWTIGTDFDVPTFPYPSGDGSGTTYTTATSYKEGDLEALNYVQSADTMYIVHKDHIPRKLTRTAHDSWAFTDFAWTDATSAVADRFPPFQDINTTDITLDPSAVTGVGIDVVASAAFFSSGHVGAYFKHDDGMYIITAVTDSTNAVATVIDDLTGHVATADWYESSWSDYRGWPSIVAFFEERLVFANNANQPQTLWMSESGDYEDFVVNSTVTASDGVTITLLAEKVNAIKWLMSGRRLLVGTTGGEWYITGDSAESAIDATESPLVRKSTDFGSDGQRPVKIGGDTIFVQRPGKKLRRFQYSFDTDSYQSTNLSVLAEHITDSVTIEEIVFQQQPNQLIWCRLSDGTMATLSFMPEHDVYAWATHRLARWSSSGDIADVESMAVIPGTTDDELWLTVQRVINSANVRYVERLKPFYFASINDAVYSDASATYSGDAATSITGLSHLEGEAVAVLADGLVVNNKTVSSGATTLSTAASDVHVGLTYYTDIKTMRLSASSPFSTVHGRLKRINKVTGRFYKSLSCKAGPDSSTLDDVFTTYTAESDQDIIISQDRDTDGVIFLRQLQPGPLTVLGLILDVEVY